jgi:hypothetical protein
MISGSAPKKGADASPRHRAECSPCWKRPELEHLVNHSALGTRHPTLLLDRATERLAAVTAEDRRAVRFVALREHPDADVREEAYAIDMG